MPSNGSAPAAINGTTTVPQRYSPTPLSLVLTAGFVLLLLTFFRAANFCYRLTINPQILNPNPSPTLAAPPRVVFVVERGGREERGSGDIAIRGLDEAVIGAYPKFSFPRDTGEDDACSICLSECKEGEVLRRMPGCLHSFHVRCIVEWLRRRAACPVCRSSASPTPTPTPTRR